ncbi:response regulator [Marinospirillum sp. MEB164]|uniref:Response regulator n=1 Tax=Marinospirillum alkalitolerans TaxID=3123374 RepID=A0ABW8PVA1_9GAMM
METLLPMHSPQAKACVWILDDEPALCDSLAWLVSTVGLKARTFTQLEPFWAAFDAQHPACVLLDIRLPQVNGLDVLSALQQRHPEVPVLMMSGHADVGLAVTALKKGARDFFEKPMSDQALIDAIHQALAAHQASLEAAEAVTELRQRYAQLTAREQEVMQWLVAGHPSKRIADQLQISVKTVDVHRHHILSKMQAQHLAALIHQAYRLGWVSTLPS